MAEVLRELTALVSGGRMSAADVPVPACLNHCINQEAFACKICGEIYENIHTYVKHGRSHRANSSMCAFCGKVWPSYSALSLHQLVWEKSSTAPCCGCGRPKGPQHFCSGSLNADVALSPGPDSAISSTLMGCPLECGLQPVAAPFVRSHLVAFHGCDPDSFKVVIDTKGCAKVVTSLPEEQAATCPRCHTKISKKKIGLNPHLAFHCLARSRSVQQRVAGLEQLAATSGEEPLLLLTQEIQGLLHHLTGLLDRSGYAERYAEEGSRADRKYSKLPPGFSSNILSWVPRGYTLQVLEQEGNNFPVIFDVWSQVVDHWTRPPGAGGKSAKEQEELLLKMEDDLLKNIASGLVPRWGNLNFDPMMLDPPDQDILNDLERQLGWVK